MPVSYFPIDEEERINRPAHLDALSHAQTIIDFPHHELHEGNHYVVSYPVDVANGGSIVLHVVAPAAPVECHLELVPITEGEAHLYIYEAPTIDEAGDGTEITPTNRNFNSANVAQTAVYHTPTVTDNGTLKHQEHWGSGRTNGGERREDLEFILKHEEHYLFVVANGSVNDNYITAKLRWYEPTPLN